MIRSQQHDVCEFLSDQLHAPKNESSHENFAQFAVGLYERQQLFTLDFYEFTRLPHSHTSHSWTARQHTHFASELPGTERSDNALVSARRHDNFYLAGLNDEHGSISCARLDKDLA